MIVSILNNKGGVAKTTTAVNLAAGLARRGRRVLLVDLDSQASASLSLGVARNALTGAVYPALTGAKSASSAVVEVSPGLSLLPGGPDLAAADLLLADRAGRETALIRAIRPAVERFDVTLMDCPPSLSLLTVNALTASTGYLVPVLPHYLALEGLAAFMVAVGQAQTRLDTSARLVGVLLANVDRRTRAAVEVSDLVRGHFGAEVFKTEVGVNIALAEAPSFGQSIFDYAPHSRGAADYEAVTAEFVTRCKRLGVG